jgi:hypothetical protein
MTEPLWAILLLVLGAIAGFASKYVIDLLRRRHDIQTRWDTQLFEASAAFALAGRTLLHYAERAQGSDQRYRSDLERVDEEHARMRALSEQLRLIGDSAVQRTARTVVHHAYSVRGLAEGKPDVHAQRYGSPPRERYLTSLDAFYRACRHQLRVAHPDDVSRYDPADVTTRSEDQP